MGEPTLPVLLERPEHCPSGYDLHLYCKYDNPAHRFNEFPWEITDCETLTASLRSARSMGWKINRRTMLATCPKCAAALKSQRNPALRARQAAK